MNKQTTLLFLLMIILQSIYITKSKYNTSRAQYVTNHTIGDFLDRERSIKSSKGLPYTTSIYTTIFPFEFSNPYQQNFNISLD